MDVRGGTYATETNEIDDDVLVEFVAVLSSQTTGANDVLQKTQI